MTNKDIYYISVIDECRSITKAASKLFVAQPALSQCLHKVEKEIGAPIFERTQYGVTETDAGKCFMEYAKTVILAENNLKKKLSDIKDNEGGIVRVGISGHHSNYILAKFLPLFNAKYPNIEIQLIEKVSTLLESALLDDSIDIGVLHPPIHTDRLNCFQLSKDEFVVIPRSTSSYGKFVFQEEDGREYIDLRLLEEEQIILTANGMRSREVCDQIFLRAGIVPKIKQICSSLDVCGALSEMDYATAIIPEKLIPPSLSKRPYYYINRNLAPDYSFYVATLDDDSLTVSAKKMKNTLMEISGSF